VDKRSSAEGREAGTPLQQLAKAAAAYTDLREAEQAAGSRPLMSQRTARQEEPVKPTPKEEEARAAQLREERARLAARATGTRHPARPEAAAPDTIPLQQAQAVMAAHRAVAGEAEQGETCRAAKAAQVDAAKSECGCGSDANQNHGD